MCFNLFIKPIIKKKERKKKYHELEKYLVWIIKKSIGS